MMVQLKITNAYNTIREWLIEHGRNDDPASLIKAVDVLDVFFVGDNEETGVATASDETYKGIVAEVARLRDEMAEMIANNPSPKVEVAYLQKIDELAKENERLKSEIVLFQDIDHQDKVATGLRLENKAYAEENEQLREKLEEKQTTIDAAFWMLRECREHVQFEMQAQIDIILDKETPQIDSESE